MSKILYNKDKWLDIWKCSKYDDIRNKILGSFKDLKFFEDEHRYFIGDKELTSVSVVTHLFKPEFDVKAKTKEMYNKYYNVEGHKYYHMLPEEIEKQWKDKAKEACELGTERHEFGESCFYYMTGQYEKILPNFKNRLTSDGGFKALYPKEEAIVNLWENIPKSVIPLLAETKVYDEKLGYAGTFDILFYYDNKKYPDKSGLYILDYKTNEDLTKNFGDTLLYPFNEMLNNSLNIYKLQLSLYENCLNNIGLKTVARRLIWLKPDGNYEKINLESYANILKNVLSEKIF